MIESETAETLVQRLAVLRSFPDANDAALQELVVAIQAAESEEHAQRVIMGFAQYEEFCPSPKAIRESLWNTRTPEPIRVESTVDKWGKCLCEGWGLVGEAYRKTYCACPTGESLHRDVTKWKVRPYAEETYTPESWLRMVNAPPLEKRIGMMQVHPSWMGREGRKPARLRTD
jgi:hypothetical protein